MLAGLYLQYSFTKLRGSTLKDLGWRFGGFNYLSGTARGYCDTETQTIYLGEIILHDSSLDYEQMKEIILHEIAHAVDYMVRGYTTHDAVYKKTCQSIGKDVGINGYMIYSDNYSIGDLNAYTRMQNKRRMQ